MPWVQMSLRNSHVFVRCDQDGFPRAEKGRVEIRYKRDDGRAYHAAVRNLKAIEGATILPDDHCGEAKDPSPGGASSSKSKSKSSKSKKDAAPVPHLDGAVIVYADGACSGNPGPAGLGVVVLDGDDRAELSEYLGHGTNNIAELTAIQRAAERLRGTDKPVRIYTDSKYSINMLTKGWKAKKNGALIAEVKEALAKLADVKLHYVPGHAGIELNERADRLAVDAITDEAPGTWREV